MSCCWFYWLDCFFSLTHHLARCLTRDHTMPTPQGNTPTFQVLVYTSIPERETMVQISAPLAKPRLNNLSSLLIILLIPHLKHPITSQCRGHLSNRHLWLKPVRELLSQTGLVIVIPNTSFQCLIKLNWEGFHYYKASLGI